MAVLDVSDDEPDVCPGTPPPGVAVVAGALPVADVAVCGTAVVGIVAVVGGAVVEAGGAVVDAGAVVERGSTDEPGGTAVVPLLVVLLAPAWVGADDVAP